MKWMVTEQTVREVSEKQRSILEAAAPLVKPQGQVFYATCTLLRQENEDVVDEFLSRHPDFTIGVIRTMIQQWQNKEMTAGPFFKLLPYLHGTDGFFGVVFIKQADR